MRNSEFEELYEQHAQALYAFLAYRTGDRALAEDLLSETFERALRARTRFNRRRGTAKAWLYSIALNCARNAARSQGVERRALERLGPPGEFADAGLALEDRDELAHALAQLAAEERDALALRFGGGLTSPEIARLTGDPLTTIEGRVYRALRKLREILGDREGRSASMEA
jgi:RNA polymerase sigma-70 factor (ECF subfamily)